MLVSKKKTFFLQGIIANRENVVISTDPRHVNKYTQEFYKLLKACEDGKTYPSPVESGTSPQSPSDLKLWECG